MDDEKLYRLGDEHGCMPVSQTIIDTLLEDYRKGDTRCRHGVSFNKVVFRNKELNDAMKAALNKCPDIIALQITKYCPSCSMAFVTSPFEHITQLEFKSVELYPEGINPFFATLGTNKKLFSLTFISTQMKASSGTVLGAALAVNTCLQRLKLEYEPMGKDGEGLNEVAQGLLRNTTLTHLTVMETLDSWVISDPAFESLRRNRGIARMSLRNALRITNKLRKTFIAELITGNTTLISLDICFGDFLSVFTTDLAKALSVNDTLEEFIFRDGNMDPEDIDNIFGAIADNPRCRLNKLTLGCNMGVVISENFARFFEVSITMEKLVLGFLARDGENRLPEIMRKLRSNPKIEFFPASDHSIDDVHPFYEIGRRNKANKSRRRKTLAIMSYERFFLHDAVRFLKRPRLH
jgi:hypothetical protein